MFEPTWESGNLTCHDLQVVDEEAFPQEWALAQSPFWRNRSKFQISRIQSLEATERAVRENVIGGKSQNCLSFVPQRILLLRFHGNQSTEISVKTINSRDGTTPLFQNKCPPTPLYHHYNLLW